MAYIPPHKRNSKDKATTSSTNVHEQSFNFERTKGKGEQREPLSKWFIVPSIETTKDDDHDSSIPLKLIQWETENNLFQLVSDNKVVNDHDDEHDGNFSSSIAQSQIESINQHRSEQKPTILVCDYYPRKEFGEPNIKVNEIVNQFPKTPWMSIAKEIQRDLFASFQNVRSEMHYGGTESIKPSFVVRFGKYVLHGIDLDTDLDTIRTLSVKTALSQLLRSFQKDVPNSFVKAILEGVVPQLGADFYAEKEYYYIKVFDKYRRHANVTCKCRVMNVVGELDICKIELNQVRHMILDISYLDKNRDLRLMLSTKRIFRNLTDDEKYSLTKLVKSAVIDSSMEGGLRWPVEKGLRWPLERESLDDRYVVIGVWHTKSKVFRNSSMKLKLRNVDWINVRTSTGEVKQEVTLEMTDIDKKLKMWNFIL
ncbi:hypothetical protein AQUCO_05800212v1 [Aquilegia coerulea]|uniref:DUF7903 domain-containing protein n=1 Tax=Aquilegia coerulea TaxID=218851 RepID=A0A2G5CF91_AQUCA|nr:hypothetical protein AQUCO_05800212v1 [Aquilegia coerulea]